MKDKKIALVYIALLQLFSCSLLAQTHPTKEQLAVQKTVVNLFEALSNRDSVALKTHCTNDLSLIEYGQLWNRDTLINKAILKNTASNFKRINAFEFIRTTTDKNTAWITYKLISVIYRGDTQQTIEWIETATLARHKKRWKVDHLHSTLIKRS